MPGQAYHITQRGTSRQKVFFTDSDRATYLKLMSQNLEDAGVRVPAWCLMKNHVHFVAVPERADSLSVLWWRLQGWRCRFSTDSPGSGCENLASLKTRPYQLYG